MDKIDILIWVIGIGFAMNFALMKIMWNSLKEDNKILREDVKDIDRRLCRIEGSMAVKAGCYLSPDQQQKLAE